MRLSLRRWKLLVFWIAITAAGAYAVAKTMGKTTYTGEGSLLYLPAQSFKHNEFYTPPDVQTLVQIIKCPELIEQVRKEFDLPGTAPTFQKAVTIAPAKQTSQTSSLIGVTVETPEAGKSVNATNRLLELCLAKYGEMRAEHLAAAARRLEAEEIKARARRHEFDLAYQKELKDRHVGNIKAELDGLARDISSIELEYEKSRASKAAADRELARLEKELSTKRDSKPEKVDDEILPPERMREIAAEETKLKQYSQQKSQKVKERARNLQLYLKGSAPRADVDTVQAEIAQLDTLIEGSRRQLKIIRESPLPPLTPGGVAVELDPVRLAWRKRAELRSKVQELEFLLPIYAGDLADKRSLLGELSQIERELYPLERDREAASQHIQKLAEDLAAIRALQAEDKGIAQSELRIFGKASHDGGPQSSSNATKLGALVIGVGMLLFLGFVAAVDLPRVVPPSVATPRPQEFCVPVLAHVRSEPAGQLLPKSSRKAPSGEAVQSLAMGIGQGVTEPGSIVLFTPLNDKVRIESVVAELGRFYARGGETVLLFDARAAHAKRLVASNVTPTRPARLDAYLDGHCDDTNACFAPTDVPALEYTRGDLTRRMNDGMLGMYRFRKLLDEMRQRYSRVLMIAPALREAGDLELLTALSEAVVLVVPDRTPADEVDPCVQSLRSAEAPLCGAVLVGETSLAN